MNGKKLPSPGFAARGGPKDARPRIVSQSAAALVLARLVRVRETGPGRWMASCPCEDHVRGDRNRSLSVRETETGDLLLHCFAGHGAAEIAAAVGLELSDLFAAAAGRGEPGRPRVPRIPWDDVFEAMEFDLRVVSLAAGRMAAGAALSQEDLAALAKRSSELADSISGVRHGHS